MLPVLFIVAVARLALGDWVEIPQISSKNQQKIDFLDVVLTTTTEPPTGTAASTATTIINNNTFVEQDEDIEEDEEEEEEEEENETQESPANFLPFIYMVQDTLLKTKNKNMSSKLSFLRNLRDSILINIEERMHALWLNPNKNDEAREYKEEHYHMDFPSNEGALMTIGFLTFAVFLIKLVLKLIHALKMKYAYYNNSDSSTASTYSGRKKRSAEEDVRILQLIEEYSFR